MNSLPINQIAPFTPAEVHLQFTKQLDPNVIQAVNNLLVRNYSPNTTEIRFLQKEMINEYFKLITIPEGKTRTSIETDLFDRNQFDIENVFRQQGWIVNYDKPAYNETYEPSFTFKPKSKIK